MNIEKFIKENFGFQESKEILEIFEKYGLFSEIEHGTNDLIDDLEEKVDELEEEIKGLKTAMSKAKEKINNVLKSLEENKETYSLLEGVLDDLEV